MHQKTKSIMTHKFIINDENIVNEYGYRVMTDGIDTKQFMRNPVVLYMHTRGTKGNEVIGRVIKLEKQKGQLIAEVEFDTEDKFAKKIAGKVERGFIKMSSIGADVIATSSDKKDVLKGQIFETVTKSKLVELSIVDIGANDNALKLNKGNKRIKLNRIKTENMSIKTIALALGMSEDTKENDVLAQVQKIKLAKDKAEQRVAELEKKQKDTETAEATALVDKAIELGLIPEALKASQLNAFATDFDNQKVTLSKLIEDKEKENDLNGRNETIKTIILNKSGKKGVTLSFDYLQKNDPEKLREIRNNQPEEYARLAKDYAKGVRHQ